MNRANTVKQPLQSVSGRVMKVVCQVFLALFSRLIPETPRGDCCLRFARFVITHERIPNATPLINNVLYHLSVGSAIRDPLRVFTTDKALAKLYVTAIAGADYTVPTLGLLRTPAEIKSYQFPARCCIKPTHASGAVILRTSNEPLDHDVIASWLDINYYQRQREANYRYLRPGVIVEPLIFNCVDLDDYKFFCYQGQPRMIQVDVNRHNEHRRCLFNTRWKLLDYTCSHAPPAMPPPQPANLSTMLKLAATLSKEFSLVRIDLYSNGNECRFGEITHCSESARSVYRPREAERAASQLVFGAP